MDSNEKVGNLEEESLKRKERLKALRKQLSVTPENVDSANKKLMTLPKPKFRSYNPTDEVLKEMKINDAKPGNVEVEVHSQLEASTYKEVVDILNVSSLAPRKPDWDLKRDAAKKLEKLERRTQRAIAELIRDRLKSEETDLATSVAIGAELQADADD